MIVTYKLIDLKVICNRYCVYKLFWVNSSKNKNVTTINGNIVFDEDCSVNDGFQIVLEEILSILEPDSPCNHVKKYQLIKSDATETIDEWLSSNPHAIISMAIFDMDIYQPTKVVHEKILSRLTKG